MSPSAYKHFNAQLPPQYVASFYASDNPLINCTTVIQRPISRDLPSDFDYAALSQKIQNRRKHYDIDFRITNFIAQPPKLSGKNTMFHQKAQFFLLSD